MKEFIINPVLTDTDRYQGFTKNKGPLYYTDIPTDVEVFQVGESVNRARRVVENGVEKTKRKRNRWVVNNLSGAVIKIKGGTGQLVTSDDMRKIFSS